MFPTWAPKIMFILRLVSKNTVFISFSQQLPEPNIINLKFGVDDFIFFIVPDLVCGFLDFGILVCQFFFELTEFLLKILKLFLHKFFVEILRLYCAGE